MSGKERIMTSLFVGRGKLVILSRVSLHFFSSVLQALHAASRHSGID